VGGKGGDSPNRSSPGKSHQSFKLDPKPIKEFTLPTLEAVENINLRKTPVTLKLPETKGNTNSPLFSQESQIIQNKSFKDSSFDSSWNMQENVIAN
jgi:hypothetical protein